MPCTIDWNSLNFSEWNQRFKKIPQAPVLQAYDYARAVCPLYRQRARWGLIRINGMEAGLCQVLEAGFPRFLHAVMLDRGPLWFDGFGEFSHFQAFIGEFTRIFPKTPLRRRRIIPEIATSNEIHGLMVQSGWRLKTRHNYQTSWLDLTQSLENLRKNLKKPWRGALSKGEKSTFKIAYDRDLKTLDGFLSAYAADRRQKEYQGPSVRFLKALTQSFGPANVLLANAYLENRIVAAILILCHGSSATYQTGWTTNEGRDLCAHHVLLWDAIQSLKSRGVQYFDLGGVHEQAAGIKSFKDGMGGAPLILPGLYV
jgi:hypothetical protein